MGGTFSLAPPSLFFGFFWGGGGEGELHSLHDDSALLTSGFYSYSCKIMKDYKTAPGLGSAETDSKH